MSAPVHNLKSAFWTFINDYLHDFTSIRYRYLKSPHYSIFLALIRAQRVRYVLQLTKRTVFCRVLCHKFVNLFRKFIYLPFPFQIMSR